MRTSEFIGAALALVLVPGCSTAPQTSAKSRETTQTPTVVVTPAATQVSGTDLDQANLEKVRVSETLKSYPVGRYIDPQDPSVMHEAHVIYRKEAGSSWNLHPNAPTVVPLGPVLAVSDPAKTAAPLPAELEQRMAEQNQLVASLIEQNEALTRELAKIGQEIAVLRGRHTSPSQEGNNHEHSD